ncbi:MAG: hypothetical protein R2724_04385 [Bryobacterales bacterium]
MRKASARDPPASAGWKASALTGKSTDAVEPVTARAPPESDGDVAGAVVELAAEVGAEGDASAVGREGGDEDVGAVVSAGLARPRD